MVLYSSHFILSARCDLSYYPTILVVGLLLVSFTDTIGYGVVHAFNSIGKVWLLIVDFFQVFRGSFSLLVLALRV
jgi:hypothetical protein